MKTNLGRGNCLLTKSSPRSASCYSKDEYFDAELRAAPSIVVSRFAKCDVTDAHAVQRKSCRRARQSTSCDKHPVRRSDASAVYESINEIEGALLLKGETYTNPKRAYGIGPCPQIPRFLQPLELCRGPAHKNPAQVGKSF